MYAIWKIKCESLGGRTNGANLGIGVVNGEFSSLNDVDS